VGEVKTALSDITTATLCRCIVRLTPDGLLDVAWNGKVLLYRVPVLALAESPTGGSASSPDRRRKREPVGG